MAKVGQRLQDKHGQRSWRWTERFSTLCLRQRGSDLFDEKGNFLPDQQTALSILEEFADMSKREIAVMPDRGSIFDPVFFGGT